MDTKSNFVYFNKINALSSISTYNKIYTKETLLLIKKSISYIFSFLFFNFLLTIINFIVPNKEFQKKYYILTLFIFSIVFFIFANFLFTINTIYNNINKKNKEDDQLKLRKPLLYQ